MTRVCGTAAEVVVVVGGADDRLAMYTPAPTMATMTMMRIAAFVVETALLEIDIFTSRK
jgi:hypothetical protein